LTSEAWTILEHLVSHQKVKVGGGYPIPALRTNARGWIATDATDALNELLKGGFLQISGDRFALTQLSYDVICKDKTVKGTKQRIVMHIYGSTGADPKRMNRGALESFRNSLSGCRWDHFDDALEELVKDGIVEMDTYGTVTLTGRYMDE
jgi:hypothetical protein